MKKRAKKADTAESLMADIERKLTNIEFLMSWSVKAKQRFRPGQRVKFSPYADLHGISRGKKGHARGGVVKMVDDGVIVWVRLDGYKTTSRFHHGMLAPVGGSRRAK